MFQGILINPSFNINKFLMKIINIKRVDVERYRSAKK